MRAFACVRYVVDRGLLSYKQVQKEETKLPMDEREVHSRLRLFSRFQSKEDHEELVNGVLEAKRLRKKIDKLQHYRRMGIRTISEGILYEKVRIPHTRYNASFVFDLTLVSHFYSKCVKVLRTHS